MARPALSLQAYLALNRSRAEGYRAPDNDARPDGPVVLGIASETSDVVLLERLGMRLRAVAPDANMVISGAASPDQHEKDSLGLPQDTETDARAFARFIKADLVLWTGQSLRPALLMALKAEGARLIHLGARDRVFTSPAPKWLPDPCSAALGLFDMFFVPNAAARRRLVRYGVSAQKIVQSGQIFDTGPALDCADAMHEEASAMFSARPLWLAAHVHAREAPNILAAHRSALKLAHRLVLALVPVSLADSQAISEFVEREGMACCHWDAGYLPDQNTQVILTEGPDELGLWYRLSPFVFLGSSLVPGLGGADPYQAASLGSAVLYGPHVGPHAPAYTRMVQAGAARMVLDADSLATAVGRLLAPELAASMAHAGWEVITEGAEAVDKVLEEMTRTLETAGGV